MNLNIDGVQVEMIGGRSKQAMKIAVKLGKLVGENKVFVSHGSSHSDGSFYIFDTEKFHTLIYFSTSGILAKYRYKVENGDLGLSEFGNWNTVKNIITNM